MPKPAKLHTYTCEVSDPELFKAQALQWAAAFDTALYLDNQQSTNACEVHNYEMILGVGAEAILSCAAGTAFDQLRHWHEQQPGWLLGYLGYDLKNEVEKLSSGNSDTLGFPDLFFFRPQHLLLLRDSGKLEVQSTDAPEALVARILEEEVIEPKGKALVQPLQARVDEHTYLKHVAQIREHISAGDVYELNYCMEFFAEQAELDPHTTYRLLKKQSPVPFSAYYRHQHHYMMGASPERFLCKQGPKLTSQPIKGTARRGATPEEEAALIQALQHSEKERAENVMITDLVRNDLARSSETGSVQVDELFGIYTFPQVHQMISTITSQLRPEVHFTEALYNAFPMGSMTGAPKVMAMELIEQYEQSRRGLYAGAVGYITPEGDFDFNVVIRSLLYNARQQYLSYHVGSAIVYDSDPQQEYQECLLKATAIRQILGATQTP